MPDISMGIYGYPVEEAVSMLAEKALWLASAMVHLKEIRFMLFESALCDLFERTLRGLLEPVDDGSPSKSLHSDL